MKSSRRTVVKGSAWAVPVVVASATIPAYAASPQPALSSTIWFSGRGVTDSSASQGSTCSVPELNSSTGGCVTDTTGGYYPWRNRFQFYATDDTINSAAGNCVRDSSIAITSLKANQITGPITLTFWRPENPDSSSDIRTWYRGANDSGLWSIPTPTGATATPFSGSWTGLKMYEYKTTLSLADAQRFMTTNGTGVTLSLTKTTAAMSFFSDCQRFYYDKTQAYLDAYDRLGRYVLTVPTTAGNLVKDTGFYTS